LELPARRKNPVPRGEIAKDAEILERREMRDRHVKLDVTIQELVIHRFKPRAKKIGRNQLKLKPLDAASPAQIHPGKTRIAILAGRRLLLLTRGKCG